MFGGRSTSQQQMIVHLTPPVVPAPPWSDIEQRVGGQEHCAAVIASKPHGEQCSAVQPLQSNDTSTPAQCSPPPHTHTAAVVPLHYPHKIIEKKKKKEERNCDRNRMTVILQWNKKRKNAMKERNNCNSKSGRKKSNRNAIIKQTQWHSFTNRERFRMEDKTTLAIVYQCRERVVAIIPFPILVPNPIQFLLSFSLPEPCLLINLSSLEDWSLSKSWLAP